MRTAGGLWRVLTPMSLPTGTRLAQYQVLALLGVGGMGEVYRATDRRLGRDVAIKVLLRRLRAGATGSGQSG